MLGGGLVQDRLWSHSRYARRAARAERGPSVASTGSVITRDEMLKGNYVTCLRRGRRATLDVAATARTGQLRSAKHCVGVHRRRSGWRREILHSIQPRLVNTVRFYDGPSATSRWGVDNGAGVIHISTWSEGAPGIPIPDSTRRKPKPVRESGIGNRESRERRVNDQYHCAPPNVLPYRDASLEPEQRVADLLARMTLEEKAAQMMCVWQQKAETLVDANGDFDIEKARRAFAHGNGIGQVGRPSDAGSSGHEPEKGRNPRAMAELTNAIQNFFIEESRLGIPVIFHEECLHGHAAVGGTSFPQPIGLARTFNPALVESLYAMTAEEARVRGTHQALTPVVDVARDARWGRVEETFGEDPYLVSRMGVAAVRGFQGDRSFARQDARDRDAQALRRARAARVGQNCAPANVSMRELREVFLRPSRRRSSEAGAISVMPSYNEVDGVPSHANRWLLRDVLRKEWGFDGLHGLRLLRDLGARATARTRTAISSRATRREACVLAVRAGVNVELPEPDCYLHLVELVRNGRSQESELDDLVAPMLFWKFRLGLFDDPYVDPDAAERVVGSRRERSAGARRRRARRSRCSRTTAACCRSMRSAQARSPSSALTRIARCSAATAACRQYHVTVLDGHQGARRQRARRSLYARRLQDHASADRGPRTRSSRAIPTKIAARSPKRCRWRRSADVIVLAIGGNEQTSREAWSLKHMGDATNLDLSAARTSSSARWSRPASRWSRCCSTAGRCRSRT